MTLLIINNRYKVVKILAEGGFGKTFLTEDMHLPSKRLCVVKQLKPIADNPQIYKLVQDRFQREAAILEELGSGNHQIPQL
jgi:serine/threonine protein kinase